MTLPLFINENLEIWEFNEENSFFHFMALLSDFFFLLPRILTFSNLAVLIVQPIISLVFDALVVYRLWVYRGFTLESGNKLSRTLSSLIFLKYTYFNNLIVVYLGKVSFCRAPQNSNLVNPPLVAYNSDFQCGTFNYNIVFMLVWVAILSQLTFNVILTSINYQANISKNRSFAK